MKSDRNSGRSEEANDSSALSAGPTKGEKRTPSGAFTIRIYVPDGDPDGVRFIDRVASTGLAISFPRAQWPRIKSRPEFERAGI